MTFLRSHASGRCLPCHNRPRIQCPRARLAVAREGELSIPTTPTKWTDESDIVVIGSGIGGLSAGALLARAGQSVTVLEAHSVPGGAAHHWERNGYQFDSGAALFSGLAPSRPGYITANPLTSVLAALGEELEVVDLPDRATCLIFPDAKQYRTQIASEAFVGVVRERLGQQAAQQWQAFQADVERIFKSAGAVQPAAVRLDKDVLQTTVGRRPLEFLRYLWGSRGLVGKPFQAIVDMHVTRTDVRDLIAMITEGTCSAGMAEVDASYMVRAFAEMWSPKTQLQYPKGGSQAIVSALERGLFKYGGKLKLRSRVSHVLSPQADPSGASGIVLADGSAIRAGRAVVSNISAWDTRALLCGAGHREEGLLEGFEEYVEALEMNDSMMHLHLGFSRREGEDLPMHTYFLESELTGANGWPTIVIPSVPDPDLAPEGCHILHATMTEPYAPWADLDRASDAYAALKRDRTQTLMDLVKQIIPDIEERVTTAHVGTPLSHERFLRRKRGAYGPKNLMNMAGSLPQPVKPLTNMFCCGDSVFPGVGTPAVSASGMWVANTLMSVNTHQEMLDSLDL